MAQWFIKGEVNGAMIAPILAFPSKAITCVGLLDSGDRSDALRVVLRSGGPGVVEVPELEVPRIAIYVGRPVRMDCRHGVRSHSGLAFHGDIDIIPDGVPSHWEMKLPESNCALPSGRKTHLWTSSTGSTPP